MSIRTARFLAGYYRRNSDDLQLTTVRSPDTGWEARLLLPRGRKPNACWIALHGLTIPGADHPTLVRFASAVARTGAAVLLPDIPEWRELRIDHEAGDRAIRQTLDYIDQNMDFVSPPILMGGSFGATQALRSAGEQPPGRIGRVVSFGGFCSLKRTLHFMFTGEHEWHGESYRLPPDPYGRWIIAANYLPHVPDLESRDALADAAAELAVRAGESGVYAADPIHDELIRELGRSFSGEARSIWSALAPTSSELPDREAMVGVADRLHDAAMAMDPGSEPENILAGVRCPVVLAHGRADHLVPFTEAFRLRESLINAPSVKLQITRLFSHSKGAEGLGWQSYPAEVANYLGLLSTALQPVATARSSTASSVIKR